MGGVILLAKNFIILILCILFMCGFYTNHSGQTSLSPQVSPCPASTENTHLVMENYLKKEATIEDLTSNYGIDIDQSSHEKVVGLDNEEYAEECDALVEAFGYLTEDDEYSYSFYKLAEHYFIVRFRYLENENFEWTSIAIVNSELESVAVALNW